MVAVIGQLGRCEPAVERGHSSVAGLSERREQVAVTVGRVGEAVHAKRERAVSCGEVLERQLVRADCPPLEILHGFTSFGTVCQM